MEASTIAAILLGSVAGGVWLTGMSWSPWPHAHWPTVVRRCQYLHSQTGGGASGAVLEFINMTRSFLNACTSLWRNGERVFRWWAPVYSGEQVSRCVSVGAVGTGGAGHYR